MKNIEINRFIFINRLYTILNQFELDISRKINFYLGQTTLRRKDVANRIGELSKKNCDFLFKQTSQFDKNYSHNCE